MKKRIITCLVAIVFIIIISLGYFAFQYNMKEYHTLVFYFGKVVNEKADEGPFLVCPFLNTTKAIFTGERLYDLPITTVTTVDKKNMICDAYVTWHITDTKKYFQKLNSPETAQSRIDVAVYSAMKNTISSLSQDEIITGKDGSLCQSILKRIDVADYGITVSNIDIKVMDLPDANKESVYQRMISERNAIAAKYTADGNRQYLEKTAEVDAKVRQIKSDAEAEAAKTIAEGENEYYSILADAYSKSKDKTEFYDFWISLQALEKSLANGGTYVVDENSPLYEILNSKTTVTTPQSEN